jgi:serine phosphatase RsbU (regulator of sigma subunit)
LLLIWLVIQLVPVQVWGESTTKPVQDNPTGTAVGQTGTPANSDNARVEEMRRLTGYQMIFTTLPLAFAVIHLILFIYFRECKENLYFAIFLFFYAANIFTDYQASLFGGQMGDLTFLLINRVMLSVQWIFSLRFVYSLFYSRLPGQFWPFSLLFLVGTVFALMYTTPADTNVHYLYIGPMIMLAWLEILRVIVKARRDKKEGVSIIALGFAIYFFFSIFDTLMDQWGSPLFAEMENPYAIGTIGFLVTMSVYLARNYSRAHKLILERERHVKELEEARKLQLSMLPQCVDAIPGMDICFHMTTATEVGGDYYDYQVEQDGTLILTVGDATGHGLNAGIMVASVKSLFQTIGCDPDIPAFFNRCTSTIKQMGMGNLFMALCVMRLKGDKLSIASAGMPPLLIYRHSRQEIEEVRFKGPPLGAFSGFKYPHKEVEIKPGDILLAISDGLPELFNENEEMFGYDRVKEVFKEAPRDTATSVVRHLSQAGNSWRNGREPQDDITLVTVKIESKDPHS